MKRASRVLGTQGGHYSASLPAVGRFHRNELANSIETSLGVLSNTFKVINI